MPATFPNKQDIKRDFGRCLKKHPENSSFNDAFDFYINYRIKDNSSNNKPYDSNTFIKIWGLPEQELKQDMIIVYETSQKLRELGAEIKRLRIAQGWSTQKLSELSGMSLGFINQLENGISSLPKASNLVNLAKIFSIDPNEFLYLAGYIDQKPVVDMDWQISIKNQLSNIGIKNNYINEIIDYIETVQVKQSMQENKDK